MCKDGEGGEGSESGEDGESVSGECVRMVSVLGW